MTIRSLSIGVIGVLAGAALTLAAPAVAPNPYYRVENIPTPAGVEPNCNGLSFLPDGRLVAAFDDGHVAIYTPKSGMWKIFASGMHTPMGIVALSEREIVVAQRPELTRLLDTDGDGVADRHDCISDAWGLSGNYHEFAFGLARDAAGNFYTALGSASGGGVSRFEMRGEFRANMLNSASGHYSPVPWRGWVVRIAPDGALTPIGAGFRQPSGLTLDPAGRLFVTDNQGDWIGTSPIHHVRPGGFYGHPGPLAWREDFDSKRSVLDYDRLRTPGAAQLPHALLANSAGQPAFDTTQGKFGPFAGQMFVPEYTIPRLFRVMLDEVDGEVQCAATTFLDGAPLRNANLRLAFAPDGSLWCSQSERRLGWPGAAGIQRVVWNGVTPPDVDSVRVTATGFDFRFTRPIDVASANPGSFKAQSYYYRYQPEYGSARTDIQPAEINGVTLTDDGQTARVELANLRPGYIYQFELRGLRTTRGEPLANPVVYYTLNRLRDGTRVALPRPAPAGKSEGTGQDRPEGGERKRVKK